MKYEVILCGVGGQGVLSVGTIISGAAVAEGYNVRQSEVHGMAQRGGAVLAHFRISDKNIASDLVPQGTADLILSMEPLEGIRYAPWLSPKAGNSQGGALVSAAEPLNNISNYPDLGEIHKIIESFPIYRIIEAQALAKEAGLAQSVNMVMVGAASIFLPLKTETLEKTIQETFAVRYSSTVEANLKAFHLGREASAK
ncbi:MAG: indolepyruvate oxidoreductase subunit beta [Treponema sp.]|nr:indolepyruvate oxidoreductase subunit beta [Treponema sp.]